MSQGFFEIDAWGELVGATASAPRHCTLGGIVKVATTEQRYVVPNEFICGRLGLVLGLPVPPGVIVRAEDGETLAYVCLRFGEKGEKPPPAFAADLVADNPKKAAGVMAFDCWILNPDRHANNLAYTRSTPLQVFDHGHAFLGPTTGHGVARLEKHRDTPVLSHCIAPEITSARYFRAWADRIASIHDDVIADLVDSVTMVDGALGLTRDEGAIAKEFLVYRKARIIDLLASNKGGMPKITDWESL